MGWQPAGLYVWTVEVFHHACWTSVVSVSDWSASRPRLFTPWVELPNDTWWQEPGAWERGRISASAGNRTSIVRSFSPYYSHYTDGANPDPVLISIIFPDRLWGPPSLLYNGYRVFLGGKAAGAWCWPPTPIFSVDVLKRVELYIYLP